jgi:UDP-N-acetylglucosamine 4,6-dehydratase/UDP-glucose 4-epimerase|tara:strand:- start:400 stop:1407 length:1008 start_codon:yes stop_codon:yes gene_type:complete
VFKDKTVLITGGTGSLGQAITKRLLEMDVRAIRIFSRNESKQIQMESKFQDQRLRFLLGDVRDYGRLEMALEDVDIVFHTAALKHVPKIEYNPFESIKTNVIGSQNVIDACLKSNVERAVCIGTDKAVSPLNTYGSTKLLMEKLFVAANNYLNREKYRTIFLAVRYGNVLGSSGSVIPKFIEQIKSNKSVTITDPEMTRFSITMNEALDFIFNSVNIAKGSEIFVPKLRAYNIMDVKNALAELLSDTNEKITGIRTGEKLHETLINEDEIRYSWDLKNMYMIASPLYNLFNDKNIKESYQGIKKIDNMEKYSSDTVERIPIKDLKTIIKNAELLN